jgi:hypothetical protein
MLLAWFVVYLAVPVWFLSRRWILSAGLVQLIGALLPHFWQHIFWPNAAGNLLIWVFVMLLPPAGLIAAGLITNSISLGKWVLSRVGR